MTGFGLGTIQPCPDPSGRYLKPDPGNARYLKQCCDNCWLAVLYVAGTCSYLGDHFGDDRVAGMFSLRSTQADGATFDIVLAIPFGEDDPMHPGSTLFLQTTGTATITVGLDTGGAWQFLTTVSMTGEPDLNVYIKAFRPSRTVAPLYCAPPEYGLPLETELVMGTWQSKAHVDWGAVFADATADLAPLTAFGIPPTWGGNQQITSYYDHPPGAGHLDVNFDVPGQYNIRVFNEARYTMPKTVRTDEPFDLDVVFYNLYTGQPVYANAAVLDPQAEKDTDTVPTAELVLPLDGATFSWSSIVQVASQAGHYKFTGCQFLTQVGTRLINVWPNYENALLGPIGFVDFWKIRSAPVRVTVGAPAYVDVAEHDDVAPPAMNNPTQAGAVILGRGMDPLLARILDVVGQNQRYNVVPMATNTVTATLSEPHPNFLAGPTLGGTTNRAAVAGIATFDNLTIHGLGRNYRITFSASGLTESGNVNTGHVDVSVATGLAFEPLPTIHAGVPCSIKVDLVDHGGSVLMPTTADDLTLSGAGSFSGFGSVTPSSGVATFTGTFPAAGTYAIQVVTSGTNYDGPAAPVTINVTVLP